MNLAMIIIFLILLLLAVAKNQSNDYQQFENITTEFTENLLNQSYNQLNQIPTNNNNITMTNSLTYSFRHVMSTIFASISYIVRGSTQLTYKIIPSKKVFVTIIALYLSSMIIRVLFQPALALSL